MLGGSRRCQSHATAMEISADFSFDDRQLISDYLHDLPSRGKPLSSNRCRISVFDGRREIVRERFVLDALSQFSLAPSPGLYGQISHPL